jgi:hypothetical protein
MLIVSTVHSYTTPRQAEEITADLLRGFWTRETGTGQQVALLLDR